MKDRLYLYIALTLYIAIISVIIFPKTTYANGSMNADSTTNKADNGIGISANTTDSGINTEEILSSQEEEFGIRDFLKETEEYMPDFMNELNLSEIFSNATTGKIDNASILEKILNLLGSQITDTLKILISILLVVLIHSLLKSITDSLENSNVAQIVYYVQYILIVTIIMANFSNILDSIKETIENLVGFAQILIPLLITLMLYTGSITTTTVIEPILLFLIEFIANIIKNLMIPIISVIVVLIVISGITEKIQINKLSNFMKSSIVWVLGIILTIFVGVVSLEGTLTASVDGITAKTAKATVSTVIPVVRKNIRRWCR